MIRLENVSLDSGAFKMESVSFAAPAGQYTVLMGKTGTGKTTLLEIICGLRIPRSGKVWIGDRDVTDETPGARGLGYVPQDGALFPTMTVWDQIAFGLKRRVKDLRAEGGQVPRIVKDMAEELGIAHLLERMPQGLSGGERQRVALARALAIAPQVLLLDEPLASLDEETQDEMIQMLQTMQRKRTVTVLHVTHSRREAERLGQVRLRLKDGRVGPNEP
jgi:molybdate/tungstate transport system ATP-binding protein